MITGGFYLLMNTVPQGWHLEEATFLINCIFGVTIVVFGSLLCADAVFG